MSSSVNGAASSPRLSTRERRFLRVQRPIASCRFRSLRRQREGWGCESTILRVQRPPASCRCRSLRLQREGWGCESTILRVQRRLPRADADFCACSARAGVASQRLLCLQRSPVDADALGVRVSRTPRRSCTRARLSIGLGNPSPCLGPCLSPCLSPHLSQWPWPSP